MKPACTDVSGPTLVTPAARPMACLRRSSVKRTASSPTACAMMGTGMSVSDTPARHECGTGLPSAASVAGDADGLLSLAGVGKLVERCLWGWGWGGHWFLRIAAGTPGLTGVLRMAAASRVRVHHTMMTLTERVQTLVR